MLYAVSNYIRADVTFFSNFAIVYIANEYAQYSSGTILNSVFFTCTR